MFRSGRRSSWSNGPAVFPAWHIVAVQESTPKHSTTGRMLSKKELLASKAQYADVVETLSPSSEPLKPSKVERETSAPKTPATSVEVAHETVEPPAESTPALPELPESTSQEEVHFVSLKCTRPSSQPAQSPQPALEISCGTTCITVTEDTPPKLLRQTLCILRDVFSSC